MSSLEKRQAKRRGSSHKCSDGISDTSSVGSFMDDTDREVSSLTERAFRSLCIGEDAIYNDLEVSSPADENKACAQKTLQRNDLRPTCQESASHGIRYEGKKTEVSTFQHSGVEVAQEHEHKSLSYISNGCMDAMGLQKSPSRVSSLIKAFSSGESYCDSGAPGSVKDKYQDFNNEPWDKSALLSIQRELTEFSSAYCPNLQSYRNHFHAVSRTNTMASSQSKFKTLSTKNLFCHSEFSPFQLWKDYNRFPFEPNNPQGVVSASGLPRWYNSPLYNDLTATHRILSSAAESRQFTQRNIEDVAVSQCSRSTVIQKALAIEKRCESEIASNCPPWKNYNYIKNKLPSNRPSTVSPSNEKVYRPDSSLLHHSRHTYEVQNRVGKVSSSEMSSRTTPFNITQLLTPVIPVRQETETSEILQFAHTPLGSECDSDLKAHSDVKQSRESYKSKASSLLFNLKDNRKRVKSTYSPTKFTCLEISDRTKQPPKLEGRKSRLSETVSQVSNQENATVPGASQMCNPVQPNYEHKNMRLVSPNGTTNCHIPTFGLQNHYPDLLTNREGCGVLTNSGHGNSEGSSETLNSRTFATTRPETEKILPKAQPPADMSARRSSAHQTFKPGKTFVRTSSSGYVDNQSEEHRAEPVNMMTHNNNRINDATPYRGEIAALIEMDKQRKATAKRYLPSADENYSMRTDTHADQCISNKQVQDDHAISQNVYDQHNYQQKITNEKSEDCLHRKMTKGSQRRNFAHSVEEGSRNTEGSVAYQPFKYEPNKQWHIATAENRPAKGEDYGSRRLQQSEIKAEGGSELNYIHPLSRAPCVQKQSTAYYSRTEGRNLTSQIHHKQGAMNTGHNVPTTQRTLQNDDTSQPRGDMFNINDILSIRDNKHAKRVKENKYSFNGRVCDPTKVENRTSPVTSDVADGIVAKPEPPKVQSQAKHDGKSPCNHENTNRSHGHVRKASHVPNDLRETPVRGVCITNENDKGTLRALLYKEKGQTKREILTSKLKAHAQKEISAIKEKGLAKHAVPPRNATKQSPTVSDDKGKIKQDVVPPQKEMTAEKTDHLFQDIIYPCVPIYQEQINQSKIDAYKSPTEEKGHKVSTEKGRIETQTRKSQGEISQVDNKDCKVSTTENSTLVKNGKDSTTCFLSSEEPENLSTTYTFNDKEHSTSTHEELVNAPTSHIRLYNVLGNAITIESSDNKVKKHLSDAIIAVPTADTNTDLLKCHDTREERPLTRPKAKELDISTRKDKTPSGWMKDDAPSLTGPVEFTETANNRMANTERERKHQQETSNQVYSKPNTEPQEKETWVEKQDIQVAAVRRTEANDDDDDDDDDDALKSSQTAHESKELGSLGLNKATCVNVDCSNENKKYSLEQKPIINKVNNETLQETVGQVKSRHENRNQQMVSTEEVADNNNRQLEQDAERDTTHRQQKAKDIQKDVERTFLSNGSSSPRNRYGKPNESLAKDHQLSRHLAAESADVLNPVPESHRLHPASEEDNSPVNEPVIYSICVSSTSDAVPEDEPMIFTISVSSLSDASVIPGPENQEKGPTEQVKKDNTEMSRGKSKEGDLLESNENSKEAKLTLNTDTTGRGTVPRKSDSPASKDCDHHRPTEVDNISSSCGSLLANCGLPRGDTVHLEANRKDQDQKEENAKDEEEEALCSRLPKILNKIKDNEHVPVEKLTAANLTKKPSAEFINSASEESPDVLQNAEQHVTHTAQAQQTADGAVSSDRNPEQDVASNQELLMSEVCHGAMDPQQEKQMMENENVQLEENKQVRQEVQKMEGGQKENGEDKTGKNTEMVRAKCAAASPVASESSRFNNDSPATSSEISPNDCRIKTQNPGESLIQSGQNTISGRDNTPRLLTYRTHEDECEEESNIQEKGSEGHRQTGDKEALQNNAKEFLEPEHVKLLITATKVNSDMEMTKYTNAPTQEHSSYNQNPIKHAITVGQSVLTAPDIPQEHDHVHTHHVERRIKADALLTRGVLPPNNVRGNAQNTTPAPVSETGRKASCAPDTTDADLDRAKNGKWKWEARQKEREIIRNKVPPLNKDPTSSTSKGDKAAECEFSEETKARPQANKHGHFKQLGTDHTGESTEETEPETQTDALEGGVGNVRLDIESRGKVLGDKPGQLDDVIRPPKDTLSGTNGNRHAGKNSFGSNPHSKYQGAVSATQQGVYTHPEPTQTDKKTTRPEISALADYARLRVIAAEDDNITERDLLEKMNTYQKYNLTAAEPQKVHLTECVCETEQSERQPVNKRTDHLNATLTPLEVQQCQTNKITDEILAINHQRSPRGKTGACPTVGSLAKLSDDKLFAVKSTEMRKEKPLTNHTPPHEHSNSCEWHRSIHSQASSDSVQTQMDDPKSTQVHANRLERKVNPQDSQSVAQASNESKPRHAHRPADTQREEESADETSEELQYYIVNGMESDLKANPINNHDPPSLSHNTEIHATAPRSNTSSPATGKPIMFRVKDNTGKTSSVTKTVRPRFHRSFSEEFSICSPVNSCFGSDHVNDLKESGNVPGLHQQSVTSDRYPGREIQARNLLLSPGFMAPKEPRSNSRRSHAIEEDESQSLISTASEDVDSLATSSAVMTNSRDLDTEHIRHAYLRPESSCSERPDSACSDMRPASRPPAVPPKTEKALRRAKRLTSRRIRKVEDKMASDIPVEPESRSIRTVSSLPASPMVRMSTTQSVHASPPTPQYHVDPNYAPAAPSIVAHSFPMTHRNLFLQDPNSGQLFMVDVPLQVKTKTFFDPETGKYLQLNVRQRAQSTLSQPAPLGVLGPPYVVYPGFLPMSVSVSSVPSVRSSSQTSAPATVPEDPNLLKARHEPSEQESFKAEHHRHVQQHSRAMYRTHEQTAGENVRMPPRKTHIIPMSELEDFAMENS